VSGRIKWRLQELRQKCVSPVIYHFLFVPILTTKLSFVVESYAVCFRLNLAEYDGRLSYSVRPGKTHSRGF
jgi:hypothetical protein